MVTVPVEGEGLVLDAVWQSGKESAAVIAPPHPLYGGSLDHPVCNEIAFALYEQGFASLRFNWRGVGASQGVPTGDAGAAERDYRAALDHVYATLPGPITAAGYSFGAATALAAAQHDERIGALLLVAPPAAMLRELSLERFTGPIRVIVGALDDFAPADELAELFEGLAGARLHVIPKVDHYFTTGGLAELSELVSTSGLSAS